MEKWGWREGMSCLDSSQIMKRNLWILKINCPRLLMNLLIGVSLGVTFQTVQWSFWLEIYLVEKLSLDLPAEDESWCLIQFSCEWEIKRYNLRVINRLQLLSNSARSSLTILKLKSSNFPPLQDGCLHTPELSLSSIENSPEEFQLIWNPIKSYRLRLFLWEISWGEL